MNVMWLFILIGAILLDLLLGDPYCLPHPVRWIGNLIGKVEQIMRKIFPKTQKGEFVAGVFLVLIVVTISTEFPFLFLKGMQKIGMWWNISFQMIFCYQLLAMKSLKTESMRVYHVLKTHDLQGARKAVSMIVGRDTKDLTEEGVTKAAVETVAENTSDGVIAPLFYMVMGGPVFGFFYKAINTMDSMVGYKNEKYLYFGRCAAKLDDFVNYIPARFSAICFVIAAFFMGYDGKNAWKIYRRDCRNHASPNSAHTEAATAGALQIRLAGNACYFGELYEKPYIGDELRPIEIEDIRRVNALMYGASFFATVFLCGLKLLWIWLF